MRAAHPSDPSRLPLLYAGAGKLRPAPAIEHRDLKPWRLNCFDGVRQPGRQVHQPARVQIDGASVGSGWISTRLATSDKSCIPGVAPAHMGPTRRRRRLRRAQLSRTYGFSFVTVTGLSAPDCPTSRVSVRDPQKRVTIMAATAVIGPTKRGS